MVVVVTRASEMARDYGVNPKSFRANLRRELAAMHEFGTWAVETGSVKHQAMLAVLKTMPRTN